jgi:hypothetical protein
MAKVAQVRLGWTRSPSDVTSQTIELNVNGVVKTIDVGPNVDSYQLEETLPAKSVVSFKIDTKDDDDKIVSSEVYNFKLGDLEDPLPATNLFHEVVAVVTSRFR